VDVGLIVAVLDGSPNMGKKTFFAIKSPTALNEKIITAKTAMINKAAIFFFPFNVIGVL
jgi:hypothetical protein